MEHKQDIQKYVHEYSATDLQHYFAEEVDTLLEKQDIPLADRADLRQILLCIVTDAAYAFLQASETERFSTFVTKKWEEAISTYKAADASTLAKDMQQKSANWQLTHVHRE